MLVVFRLLWAWLEFWKCDLDLFFSFVIFYLFFCLFSYNDLSDCFLHILLLSILLYGQLIEGACSFNPLLITSCYQSSVRRVKKKKVFYRPLPHIISMLYQCLFLFIICYHNRCSSVAFINYAHKFTPAHFIWHDPFWVVFDQFGQVLCGRRGGKVKWKIECQRPFSEKKGQ